MDNKQTAPRQLTFALSRDEAWTVHHVVLDRIEAETTSADREPPSIDVYRVFDKLEAGTERFTRSELKAMRVELESSRETDGPTDRDEARLAALVERLGQRLDDGPDGRRDQRREEH